MRVKSENEIFKRNIKLLETEQKKEYRKVRESIKKKEQQIEKQVIVNIGIGDADKKPEKVQRRGMEGLVARRCELEADCKRLEQKQRDALNDVM